MLIRKTLLIFLCTWTLALYGQYEGYYGNIYHTVTTDYNTCLVGVKDTSGNWIIPAVYEELDAVNRSEYVAYAGGRCGIIDTIGRIIIPLMYDHVHPYGSLSGQVWKGYYSVSQDGYQGIVDRSNKVFVPIRYWSVNAHNDSTVLAGDRRGNWWVYRYDGTSLQLPWKSASAPHHAFPHTYIFKRNKFFCKFRYGVMNDSGKVILERKYNNAIPYGSTRTIGVTYKGKTGFYSPTGEMYWPPVFQELRYNYFRGGSSERLGYAEIAAMSVNGKAGLVSVYGDTLLPFAYDHMSMFKTYGVNTLWTIDSADYTGVYDQNLGWILPLDTNLISTVTSWTNPVDSSSVGLIITGREGRYGAMLTNGQIIVPFNNSVAYHHSYNEIIFVNGDSLLLLNTVSPYGRQSAQEKLAPGTPAGYIHWFGRDSVSYMSRSNTFGRFEGRENMIAFYNGDRTRDSLRVSKQIQPMRGNYGDMYLPDSIALSAQIIVRPLRNVIVQGDSFRIYGIPEYYQTDAGETNEDFVFMYHHGKPMITDIYKRFGEGNNTLYMTEMSDVLRHDGTTILDGDTLGFIDVVRFGCDGEPYFQAYVHGGYAYYDTLGKRIGPVSVQRLFEFTEDYAWTYGTKSSRYRLIDRRTNETITPPEVEYFQPQPIWDSVTILKNTESGTALYNIPQRKILLDHMNSIRGLDVAGNCFAVRTCMGRLGVVDRNGKWLVDTLYTAMVPTVFDTMFTFGEDDYNESYNVASFYHYWIFTTADTTLAFDVRNQQLLSAEATTQLLWKQNVVVGNTNNKTLFLVDSIHVYQDYHRSSTIYLTPSDSAGLLPWQFQALFDSAFAPQDFSHFTGYRYSRVTCTYCSGKGVRWQSFEWYPFEEDQTSYMVVEHADSLFCFSEFATSGWRSARGLDYSDITNIMLFPDGPRELLIDSLFIPASDWRNFLINTVLNYVNSHSDIRGDCHNPAGIPNLLKRNFLITQQGLVLLPYGFYENSDQLQITVPWKDVDALLRPDIKSRLPINEKK